MKRTVLITGSSRGIGESAARLFAENGYNVVINYLNSRGKAEALYNELSDKGYQVILIKADVADYEQVLKMFKAIKERFFGVDILVNNAAISESKLVIDMTPEDFKRVVDINLTGCFNTVKAALPYMTERKQGKIINISSIWGLYGASLEAHYSASKAGMIGFSKALAKEYAPSNIQVNCIAPGVIDTDMNRIYTDEEIKDIIDRIPSGRMGTPREVAELILFLSSDKASYITGQVIGIDGGFYG